MNQDLIRAFFHELGHFVSREISSKYAGLSPTAEIALWPHERYGHLYEGHTAPVIPEGEDINAPVTHVPEILVNLVYGCFFEALYLKGGFKTCFNPHSNGHKDLGEWNALLSEQGIRGGEGKRDEIIASEEEHFKQLRDTGFFEKIRELDIPSFLVNGERTDAYTVDIEKLRSELKEFIEGHESLFLPYLERIRKLIDKYKG